MKIAILLSTYNGEEYLWQQLDSLVHQTVADSVRLYVRDDGSTDQTVPILESFRDRLLCTVIRGDNIGPAQSFWRLFTDTSIRADYYAFCDQDDVWDSDKLEKGIRALENKTGPQLWCSNCRVIDGNGRIVRDLYHEKDPVFTLPAQFLCGAIQGCAILLNDAMRQYILQRNFSEFPMHDFVLITHAIYLNSLTYDSAPSFGYRIHGENYFAREERTDLNKIRSSLRRWFAKGHRHSFADYAAAFLRENQGNYEKNEETFLKEVAASKRSVMSRIRVIRNPLCVSENERIVRSFKLRTLLGIL